MVGKKLLFILTPILPLIFLGTYYTNNSVTSDDYEIIKGSENIELVNTLKKSKKENKSNELIGYTSWIEKTPFHHIGQTDLYIRGGFQQKRFRPFPAREAEKLIDTIKDYSIKLETPCGAGTGWFLDYVLPKNNTYPTKWLIATNAHVIEAVSFYKNPFNQRLPRGPWKGCRVDGFTFKHTPFRLAKEKPLTDYETEEDKNFRRAIKQADQYPEYWNEIRRQIAFIPEMNLSDVSKPEERLKDDKYLYFYERNPKLFYVALNYLGRQLNKLGYPLKRKNYYKDFAVLYVDFGDPETSKAITRDFHTKYFNPDHTPKDVALNFFAPELISQKTSDQLTEESEDFFIAGYASNGIHPYRSSGNYRARLGGAGRLTYMRVPEQRFALKNKYGTPIIGHVNVGKLDEIEGTNKTTVRWRGFEHSNWGYNYLLDNANLSSGASGSLTIDQRRNVLGLYRMHDSLNKHAFIEPLRSKGIYKDGKIIYPGYDLIEGTKGQLSSYKSQVVKYLVEQGEETYLSKARNWITRN